MRVLFVTLAGHGHIYPMVPLAWALRAAGHQVRVAAEPYFCPVPARSGLLAVPVGHDVDMGAYWRDDEGKAQGYGPSSVADLERDRVLRAISMFRGLAEAVADDLIALVRDWAADLVVYDPRAYGGLIAAEKAGIPAVRHLWGPDATYLIRETDDPLLEPLWETYGLDKVDQCGTVTIDPCPPSLQVPADYPVHRMRYVTHNGGGLLPDWAARRAERPRVAITWGTNFSRTAGHLDPVHRSIEALEGLDVEAVVTLLPADRELLGPVPDNVRLVDFMPLDLLLPVCDLIVNQAGPGTALTAMACGVPQVLVPTYGDEWLNAERLVGAGAAIRVPGRPLTAAALREGVERALGDRSVRDAAAALARENEEQPAPARIVPHLEALAGRTREGGP